MTDRICREIITEVEKVFEKKINAEKRKKYSWMIFCKKICRHLKKRMN